MFDEGIPRAIILEQLVLNKSTLSTWIRKHRAGDPHWIPATRERTQPPCRSKVGDVRRLLGMLDTGMTDMQVSRETGYDPGTLRRWRKSPRYREATLEYDPAFTYDPDDLLDRAVVAQHLCSETTNVGERFDLLMAVITAPEQDEFAVPSRNQTRRKGR